MKIRKLCGALALLASMPVFAGLGAAPTPNEAAPLAFDGYTVNELRDAGGGVVREYLSPAGVVFGVSWRTPLMPDLRILLGEYFATFERAAEQSRSSGRRGPVGVDSPELVLQSGGQMRSYRGRAYVPGLLPPSVPADAVQ